MGLQFFNRLDSTRRMLKSPQVIFGKTGNIRINPSAAQQLNLKVGDSVEFAFDEDERQWYIALRQSENGFVLRGSGKHDHALQFNSSTICKRVAAMFKATESGASVLSIVAKEPLDGHADVYPLLMSRK